jgi:hypothetical protein
MAFDSAAVTVDALPDVVLGYVLALAGHEHRRVSHNPSRAPARALHSALSCTICACERGSPAMLRPAREVPGRRPLRRRAVTSVCRRWRRVYWGEPSLWRGYRAGLPREAAGWYPSPNEGSLTGQLAALWRSLAGPAHPPPAAAWLDTHARVLRRIGRHLASVELLLDTGHPAVPTACTPAFVELLGTVRDAAPALAHLKLAAYALPAAASDVLSTLSGLRSLHLELRSLSSANLDSLVPLAGSLTSLVLYANACLAPKGLQPLAALTRLQQLELASSQRRPLLPAPAALPYLRRYAFSSYSGSLEVGGGGLPRAACAWAGWRLELRCGAQAGRRRQAAAGGQRGAAGQRGTSKRSPASSSSPAAAPVLAGGRGADRSQRLRCSAVAAGHPHPAQPA